MARRTVVATVEATITLDDEKVSIEDWDSLQHFARTVCFESEYMQPGEVGEVDEIVEVGTDMFVNVVYRGKVEEIG